MKDRIDLGIRTSARRVDRCSRVCTRGVQRIRPVIFRARGLLDATPKLVRPTIVVPRQTQFLFSISSFLPVLATVVSNGVSNAKVGVKGRNREATAKAQFINDPPTAGGWAC